jgi:hypothetical protein
LEEMSGRRVVIENYYDRLARFDLVGVSYGDSAETASRKKYPLLLRIKADISVVDLIEAPEYLKAQPYLAEDELPDESLEESTC